MPRKFKTTNYEEMLGQKEILWEVLSPNHLACFVVDIISQLNPSSIYGRYTAQGGEPLEPKILLGLLFYGYVTSILAPSKSKKRPMRVLRFGSLLAGCILTMTRLPIFAKPFWLS
jgi:hypothetical protein